MASSRTPRPRRPRDPHAAAIRRRRARRLALRTTFARLAVENPRLASAVLRALQVIAVADRRRAMQLVEAASTIVSSSPTKAPGPEEL